MKKTLEIFQKITEALLEDEQQNPVSNFIPSSDLYNTLDLSLPTEGVLDDELASTLEKLVLSSPKTASKAFFNQLFGGRNEKAVLGDLLAVLLNNSMYTYKAAGAQIGVEKIILDKVCEMLGWSENGGGSFAPGGSMTNFMALLMARDAKKPNVRAAGVSDKQMVYTSSESHYSIPKNAALAGMGRDQVRYVKVDEYGKMIPRHLEQLIEEDIQKGFIPTFINATAGTTVLGAFDELTPLLPIAKKYAIWLHVDGAYCGSVIFSQRYKNLVKSLDEVDSFSFNAHKMIGTPLSCSLLLVKDKKYLYHSFSNEAAYLYQTDEDEFNPGKTSLQCGRRNDALKFWTLWKSVGSKGLEAIIDKQFELADTARDYINSHPDYTLYSYPDSISVCFNYKGISARDLCTALYEHEKLLVGYGSFNDNEFVRLVTINAQNETDTIIDFFKTLERFVAENESLFVVQSLKTN